MNRYFYEGIKFGAKIAIEEFPKSTNQIKAKIKFADVKVSKL